MSNHTLNISTDSGTAKVELDGCQISGGLKGLTIEMAAGKLPTLTLTLDPGVFDMSSGEEVNIYLTEPAKDLLHLLGWTPPAEQS